MWLALLVAACAEPVAPGGGGGGSGDAGDVALFSRHDSGSPAADGGDTGQDGMSDADGATDAGGTSDAGVVADAGGDGDDASDAPCPSSCDDNIACTLDVCSAGTCTHNLLSGTCYAAGLCHFKGAVAGDPCHVCDPDKGALALQPVATGSPCDDGSACTSGDACDGKGDCKGVAAAGCCKSDFDCIDKDPCVVGVCDLASGACTSKGTPGCCKAGLCCDLAVGAAKSSGVACGSAVVASEWACAGAEKKRRDAVPGCDGKGPDGCSSAKEFMVFGDWKVVSLCPTGQLCVPAAAGVEPSCGAPPECTTAVDCNDGEPCTADACDGGKCTHTAEKAGAPCGAAIVASEYKCSGSGTGAAILVRHGVSACDGAATTCPATTAQPVFGKWTTLKTCAYYDVCEVADPSKPGICKGAPKCKPGTTCCDDKGEYLAKNTACADKIVDEQYQCKGAPPGNIVQKRTATPGCAGSSTTCYEYSSGYWAWSAWADVKTCGAKESCGKDGFGKGVCTTKTQCSPSSGCCTADGFYQAKGSVCSTASGAAKTEKGCESKSKGGWIQERSASYGCSGESSSCSYLSENYVWSEWNKTQQCQPHQACDDSFGYVSCVSAGVCSPTSGCCDVSGEYVPSGNKCKSSSSAWETERKCDGSKIMVRKAWPGCSGKSPSCSYGDADLVWDAWSVEKDCGPTLTCKGTTYPYCGS